MQSAINSLTNAGIRYEDAVQLRRISMTLHRWHELECGDGNNYASWSLVRDNEDRSKTFVIYGVTMGSRTWKFIHTQTISLPIVRFQIVRREHGNASIASWRPTRRSRHISKVTQGDVLFISERT